MIATAEEGLAKVELVIGADIVPTPEPASSQQERKEDTTIREAGFSTRANFFVGAIVLAALGTAALMVLRFVLRSR